MATQEIAKQFANDGGLTPLAYMLEIMRDEDQSVQLRFDAAKAAAQYMHPRLSAVDYQDGGKGVVLNIITGIDDGEEPRCKTINGTAATVPEPHADDASENVH